jgi:uncharacterized protein YerC
MSHELQHTLQVQLQGLVSKLDKNSANIFLGTLLSPTEQIMIGKRLAVVIMLEKGASSYKIKHTLDMSSSTIFLIKKHFDNGGYEELLKILSRTAFRDVLNTIEVIMRAGLPPRNQYRWQSTPGFGSTRIKKGKK